MDHLFWIIFDVLFAVFNGAFAVANFRKAQGPDKHLIWALLQTALVLLCAAAALMQVGLWLNS